MTKTFWWESLEAVKESYFIINIDYLELKNKNEWRVYKIPLKTTMTNYCNINTFKRHAIITGSYQRWLSRLKPALKVQP